MIFALGFLAACLLALLALPIVSGRARRDERLGLERRLPLSLAEIAAERDQLRAAHAVEIRQAEQRAEALEPRLAAAMAEAGRHSAALAVAAEDRRAGEAAIADLQSRLSHTTERLEASEARLASQDRQVETLAAAGSTARDTIAGLAVTAAAAEARAREAEAMAGAQAIAMSDLAAQADRDAGRLADATARLTAVTALADERRAALAGLETGRAAMQDRPSPEPVGDEGAQLHAALTRLRKEQSLMSKTVAAATGERDRLRLRVDELLLRIEDLQAEADAAGRAGLAPGTSGAETGNGGPRDAAALRLAIAALAAELVRHATEAPETDAR